MIERMKRTKRAGGSQAARGAVRDVCIIGGAGHVGLPLGVAFANAGIRTVLLDTNTKALESVRAGRFPFLERNGDRELRRALRRGTLMTAEAPGAISKSRFVVLVVGTPVDEYLNPDFQGVFEAIGSYSPFFRDGQVLILRSTVYPGTSERLQKYFRDRKRRVAVAFCPERLAQGNAFADLATLPQIVSAFDAVTLRMVSTLFGRFAPQVIPTARPVEAELAKLFSNAWRYIKFAVGNQFFMIADDHHLDYHRIYDAMVKDYPRNADLPPPGFAAGPCLLKDTMQLAAFHSNNFFLGHAAMLVNEGMPNFLMKKLKQRAVNLSLPLGRLRGPVAVAASLDSLPLSLRGAIPDLKAKTVGILGMAFKGNSDDPRDSLAYKLRKIAEAEAGRVLCTNVYIKIIVHPLEKVLKESDIVILAAPHREYAAIDPRRYPGKHFVDIWNFWPRLERRQVA